MDIYKVYVMTKKKDGTITRSDSIIVKEESKDDAIPAAIKYAKNYGFKGKVHVGSVYKRNENKLYDKV
jgi:hypothetical protein